MLPLSEKVCMYRGKHSIYRVQNYPRFQASTGGCGTYPTGMREDHYDLTRIMLRERSKLLTDIFSKVAHTKTI